ncbi:MAG: hypothetical protein AB1664_08040 [Thermodesulfobacteriota bacterium]
MRDALASFAASLERYYEFALRVICRQRSVEPENFNSTWGFISKQSERQFGGFIVAWLLETGQVYTAVSKSKIERMTKLRNEVVHRGKIPTDAECIGYGQYVLDIAAPLEEVLLSDYTAAYKDECFARADEVAKSSSSPLTILTIFSVFRVAMKGDRKLEPALKRLKDFRRFYRLPTTGDEYTTSQIITHR